MVILSVILLNGLTAWFSSLPSRLLFLRLLGGPITGWIEAYQAHAFPSALQLLIPLTGITAVLTAAYVRLNSGFALGTAAACWFISGLMFAIGVGV